MPNNRRNKSYLNPPMTADKLYTSLPANTVIDEPPNHFQWTTLVTSSTDKHYLLDSEDESPSLCRNVRHQQQFFSELPPPWRSHNTNYWYSWVQTTYYKTGSCLTKRWRSIINWSTCYEVLQLCTRTLVSHWIQARVSRFCFVFSYLFSWSCHFRAVGVLCSACFSK